MLYIEAKQLPVQGCPHNQLRIWAMEEGSRRYQHKWQLPTWAMEQGSCSHQHKWQLPTWAME